MNLSKVIGIISYFPEDKNIKNNRKIKLDNLISKCNLLFNLPIILVAQNYTEHDLIYFKNKYKNVLIHKYQKLGIVGARNKLRHLFLNNYNFDYLIMLDDDIVLEGDSKSALEYLKQINEHPNCFGEFNKTLLKLFAISRYIFSKECFDENVNPEKEEGFEDRYFVNILRVKYSNNRFIFNVDNLNQYSEASCDKNSTWYKQQNLSKMLLNTKDLIDNIKY